MFPPSYLALAAPRLQYKLNVPPRERPDGDKRRHEAKAAADVAAEGNFDIGRRTAEGH